MAKQIPSGNGQTVVVRVAHLPWFKNLAICFLTEVHKFINYVDASIGSRKGTYILGKGLKCSISMQTVL